MWRLIYVIFGCTCPKVHFFISPQGYTTFFSCSVQMSTKFVMLIYLEFLTIANSFLLNIAEHEIFSANKYENANFHIY